MWSDKGSGVIKIKVISMFDLVSFQSSQNNFRSLILKVWSKGWC